MTTTEIHINLETGNPAVESKVTAACLGSCSILAGIDPASRLALVERCAQQEQIYCGGPRQGQQGVICGQLSNAAKSLMMQQVRAARE